MRILPLAIRMATIMAVIGLVCGVLYSVGGFFIDLFTTGLNLGTVMAFGALIGMPLIFGAFGFVFGAVCAIVTSGVGALVGREQR